MWLLVLLVAVSVVVTVVARRRGRDERDSVDAQQRRTDALRTAVTGTSVPSDPSSALPPMRPGRRERQSRRFGLSAALIAGAVVVAGLAIFAIAAGWDTGSTPAEDQNASPSTRGSSTTTSSSSTTTTTTTTVAAIPTVTRIDGSTVTVSVPAGPYQLKVAANDPCWTQIAGADGTVVQTETLQAGGVIDLQQTGPVTVRLGRPSAVEVSIDGRVLALPPGTGSAMELSLVPAT